MTVEQREDRRNRLMTAMAELSARRSENLPKLPDIVQTLREQIIEQCPECETGPVHLGPPSFEECDAIIEAWNVPKQCERNLHNWSLEQTIRISRECGLHISILVYNDTVTAGLFGRRLDTKPEMVRK